VVETVRPGGAAAEARPRGMDGRLGDVIVGAEGKSSRPSACRNRWENAEIGSPV
jgi:hypothetical protein